MHDYATLIDTTPVGLYHECVVVLHGELAVPYTRNPPQRGGIPPFGKAQEPMSQKIMLRAGSHAAQACKPRQVRKEATVSENLRVPWECLTRVIVRDKLRRVGSKGGARSLIFKTISGASRVGAKSNGDIHRSARENPRMSRYLLGRTARSRW
jgi:hypothetical protein